jgi:hypothetical protein
MDPFSEFHDQVKFSLVIIPFVNINYSMRIFLPVILDEPTNVEPIELVHSDKNKYISNDLRVVSWIDELEGDQDCFCISTMFLTTEICSF